MRVIEDFEETGMSDTVVTENKGGLAPVGPAPISVSDGDLTAEAEMEPESACTTYMAADALLQDLNSLPNAALDKIKKTISALEMTADLIDEVYHVMPKNFGVAKNSRNTE